MAMERLNQLMEVSEESRDTSAFRVLGLLRIGMILDAQGERDRAVLYYREVLNRKDHSGAHDRARRYLDEPYGR